MGIFQSTQAKQQNPNAKPSNLQDLPLELQYKIFEFLDYPSALFLTATCRFFHHNSSKTPLEFQSVADKELFFLKAENFCHNVGNLGYACFKCFEIKSYREFARKQVSGDRRKGGGCAYRRFCVDCGLIYNIYARGSRVRKADGRTIVV